MKIRVMNGNKWEKVEIEKCDTMFLAKRLGAAKTSLKTLYILFSIIFIPALIMCIIATITEGISSESIYIILGIFLSALFVVALLYLVRREPKAIEAELNKRSKVISNKTSIEREMKSSSKRTLIIVSCLIVLLIFIMVPYILSNIGNDTDDKCRNCGKDKSLVPGYGFCYDCFDGFTEWQKEEYKK